MSPQPAELLHAAIAFAENRVTVRQSDILGEACIGCERRADAVARILVSHMRWLEGELLKKSRQIGATTVTCSIEESTERTAVSLAFLAAAGLVFPKATITSAERALNEFRQAWIASKWANEDFKHASTSTPNA